jgi:hypothetical protein
MKTLNDELHIDFPEKTGYPRTLAVSMANHPPSFASLQAVNEIVESR